MSFLLMFWWYSFSKGPPGMVVYIGNLPKWPLRRLLHHTFSPKELEPNKIFNLFDPKSPRQEIQNLKYLRVVCRMIRYHDGLQVLNIAVMNRKFW